MKASIQIAVSIPKACQIADLGKDILYGAINQGELKSLKVGRRRLILITSLEAWLQVREELTQREMGFADSGKGGQGNV